MIYTLIILFVAAAIVYYIPLPVPIKNIAYVILGVILLVALLSLLGVPGLHSPG